MSLILTSFSEATVFPLSSFLFLVFFYITFASPILTILVSLDSSHSVQSKYVGFIARKPPVSGKLDPDSRGDDVGAADVI